ncbi:MAG: hypothetical protein AABX64_00955 [Nanoarchaeota archaeon]
MNFQLYYTPHSSDRLDTSQPCRQNIADILLNHGNMPPTNFSISRTVTVPDQKSEMGWRVTACQVLVPVYGRKVIVDLLKKDRMYEFREMLISRYGAERLGYVSQPITFEEFELLNLSPERADPYSWYHFTGTSQELLEELKKRAAINILFK